MEGSRILFKQKRHALTIFHDPEKEKILETFKITLMIFEVN